MRLTHPPFPTFFQAGQWMRNPASVPVSILTGKPAADRIVKNELNLFFSAMIFYIQISSMSFLLIVESRVFIKTFFQISISAVFFIFDYRKNLSAYIFPGAVALLSYLFPGDFPHVFPTVKPSFDGSFSYTHCFSQKMSIKKLLLKNKKLFKKIH